jgi:hypothetical protein
MKDALPWLIFLAGIGQLVILLVALYVPFWLNWKKELQALPKLIRQLYLVYGGFVLLSISSLGLISLINSSALADGSVLSRCVSLYIGVFWGVRLILQRVLDIQEYLNRWWLKWGYNGLTAVFLYFAGVFFLAAALP